MTLKQLAEETPAFGKKITGIVLEGKWGGETVVPNLNELKAAQALVKLNGKAIFGDVAALAKLNYMQVRYLADNSRLFVRVDGDIAFSPNYKFNLEFGYFVEVC